MKLKTEVGSEYPEGYGLKELADFEHDVAAAHALIQAMDDLIAKWGDGTCCIETAKGLILERASELMAQWGFDSGEDA